MRKILIAILIAMSLLVLCSCQSKPAENAPTQGANTPSQTTEQKPVENASPASGTTIQQGTRPSSTTPEPAKPKSEPSKTQRGGATPATTTQAPAERPAPTQQAPAAQPSPTPPQQSSAKQAAKAPSAPILLTGAPMGGVRFEHSKHPVACQTCHHPSREARPATAPQQACTSCHTKPPQPGMKTGKQAAFHNPTATAGTCIDCHKKSGGAAPTKCAQCHKKENA